MLSYADVAVNSPAARRSVFSYSIPSELSLQVGHAVWVPFGSRTLQGIVVALTSEPAVPETREVEGMVATEPVLAPVQVALARWMSERHLAPLFDCLALMLPPGFERGPATFFNLGPASAAGFTLNSQELAGLELVRRKRKVSLRELEKLVGKSNAARLAAGLVKKDLLVRSQEFQPPRVGPKVEQYVSLAISATEAAKRAVALVKARSKSQAAVIDWLASVPGPVPLSRVRRETHAAASAITSLLDKGLLSVEPREVVRDPMSRCDFPQTPIPHMTEAQQKAWSVIEAGLISRHPEGEVVLLHGVTGSGKTELYMRALEKVVAQGKRGIMLVPEISLTPQTIGRFSGRFPGRVAVLHSRLSPGEQHDEWWRIKRGEFDVVIGPRSALFAPQPDLGLIVIDEEHEWSYKQQENQPRYHAREVAIKMSGLLGVTMLLGSATPDLETYHRAETGVFRLLELSERITPWGPTPLPEVRVVDMREELKAGNRSIFSLSLQEALANVLSSREQAIIFLNRRGSSTFVLCRSCGYVLRCRRCQVSLTYHMPVQSLVCHQCNSRYPVPLACPACMSRSIRFLGIGTEKVEELLWQAFPRARTMRWDSDSSARKGSDQEIFDRFVAHDADILIGTQMIAKGLDMPLVTLVGVINADISMYLPDYRAGERTFQLLCQVAGRAGRGESGGRVIIQTYNPEHYAIKAAANHDYGAFYRQEISFRRSLGQPPFTRLIRLVYSHTNEARCREEAERLSRVVAEERDAQGVPGFETIGPAPAFVSRLRGKYRWQLILKGTDPARLLVVIPLKQGWIVDVDPVSVA